MRKFLALFLTICMLSTLVVMPVSAAETTIFLVDADDVVLGDNTTDDGTKVVFDAKGDSFTYTFNVPTTGVYKLATRISDLETQYVLPKRDAFVMYLYVDGHLLNPNMGNESTTGAEGTYTAGRKPFETVKLEAGSHTFKVENAFGSYKVDSLQMYQDDYCTEASVNVTKFTTHLGINASDAQYFNNSGIDGYIGIATNMRQNQADTISGVVGIPADGFYKISANVLGYYGVVDVTTNTFKIAINGTETAIPNFSYSARYTWKEITLAESVPLTKGVYPFTISCTGSGNIQTGWDELMLTKTGDLAPLAVESFKANGDAFTNGDTIIRGADSFEIDVNMDVKESTVSDSTVSIKNGDETVAANISPDGDKIKIDLKETLDYGTTYSLNISGVKDVLNRDLTQTISFTTVTQASGADAGTGTVTVASETLVGNTVTVSGTVESSADLLIKGRNVQITVAPPTTTAYETDAVVTNENGEFELSYNLPTDGESGVYTFTVHDEYAFATPFEHLFVTEGTKIAIVDGITGSTQASDVDAVFTTYGEILGLDYAGDLDMLTENGDGLFQKHLIGYANEDGSAVTVDDIKAAYEYWLTFEKLNQTSSTATVTNYLYGADSADKCAALGLNKAKLDLIEESGRAAFATEVAGLAAQTSLANFKAELEKVLNNHLASKHSKTPNLAVSTASVTVGTAANFDLKFDAAQTDVTSVQFVLANDGGNATAVDLENIKVKDNAGNELAFNYADGKAIITFDEVPASFDKLGTVSIDATSAGNLKIDVEATVVYEILDNDITLEITKEDADEFIITATAYTPSPGGGGNGGGGGGGVGSPAGSSKVEKEDLEETPSTDKPGTDEPGTDKPGTDEPGIGTGDFEFNDIESVDWATESINSLLDKGIISKSADGKFNPNNEVTREEFVKMMVVAMGVYDEAAASNLKDVDKNEWYAAYVASAEKAGLISGNDDGTFGVGDEISREDMSVIIYRAMAKLGLIEAVEGGTFADDVEISDYAKEAVYALKDLGILNGVGDNKFAPQGTATRAMAAKVIYGMLEGLGK